MFKIRFISMLVLLAAVATGAVAQTTYRVSLKGSTEDATSWQGKAGTGEYQALPLKRVAAGTAVSVKYSGTKLVKSVKGTKKVKPAAEATAEDKGKVIGIDGKIYDTKDEAEDAGTTAVAKICYVSGSNGFGLALALTDEGYIPISYSEARDVCSAKNTSTPVTGATWLLASHDQWESMMGADGAGSDAALQYGFSSVGGSNLKNELYWSSTSASGYMDASDYALAYNFFHGGWRDYFKNGGAIVRACLSFGTQGSDPDLIDLSSSANNTWAIAEMPAGGVELRVEYFNITVPTANTADIYAGSTTRLINAGSTTEDGATMKYLVTATNEQPTSTDGFSADVPTAEATAITGPGTYYVWYYLDLASGDDSDISALAVEVTVKAVHVTMKRGTEDATSWQGKAGEGEYQSLPLTGLEAGTAVSVKYSGGKLVKSVKATKKPTLSLTSPAVGQVIGDDGKNYNYASLPGGVTAVAKICYVSGSNGLALALADEGPMYWDTAISTCAAHTPEFTNGTWKLATKDEWTNMITAAGSYTVLRDGFSSVGGTNMQSDGYWSSTESDSDNAWYYDFNDGDWNDGYKGLGWIRIRACLAFGAQETVTLNHSANNTWAQEKTLLTTILSADNTSFTSGSKTFDNIATVTFSDEVLNVGDYWGWCYNVERTLTVTAAEGYTITRVKFYTTSGSAFDEEAPFEAIFGYKDGTIVTKVNGTSIGEFGVTKIEVYGYVNVNHSANNTWTLAATPAFDVEVEYFNITVPTANTADIYAGWTTPLINAGSTTEEGATMKYLVTATNEQPTSTDGFSADVPTAQGRTAGTYYVWYYLDFESGDDSDISALAVEVTVSVPTYKVTMKEGTEDASNWQGKAGEGEYQALPLTGLEAGTAVSVKYNGTKKVKSVKAKKAAPALNLTSPAVGQVIGDDGKNYDYASLPGGVAAVAKICYVSGSNGLALALADEGQMFWSTAISTCAAHTPAFTGGTWKLPSMDDWNNMITAAGGYTALRDGFSGITGASNLQEAKYWSSTEYEWDSRGAMNYHFGEGSWDSSLKEGYPDGWVRACLAFGAQGSDPDPIELTSTDGETWTHAATPAFDVELEVEYETALALSEVDDNTAKLEEWDGYEADVTLTRTLATGSWNTFAMPFTISSSTLNTLGITAKKLVSSSLTDGTLTLNFEDAENIEAGKPYLVKVSADLSFKDNTFNSFIVSKTATNTETDAVDFIPTLGATTIEGSDTKAVLFLAANNTLLNPSALPADMKGFRAYFQLKGEAAVKARSFSLDFGDGEATGIIAIGTDRAASTDNATYTLDGRRISKATQKGVYIQNGKKVIIK